MLVLLVGSEAEERQQVDRGDCNTRRVKTTGEGVAWVQCRDGVDTAE